MLWIYGYLTLFALVVAWWGWINLATTYRSSLRFMLGPWDAPAEHDTAGQPLDPPHEQVRAAAQGLAGDAAPPVAILCPGRNEAAHLPETLPELCAQDYPDYRIVFIDDASDDATPTITDRCAEKYAHLSVLRNEAALPDGWVGKCWALHRGYAHLQAWEARSPARALAEWVCFTDADIHWDPRCLRSAMALARHTGADVVALGPKLVFGKPVEAIVQLQLLLAIGLLLPLDKAMDPSHPDTITGGAFILVRRSMYDRIGGHEAVRDRVVDDINLGRKLKAAGARIRVALAPQLQWARMYHGWREMWEGLTKNAYAGLEYKPHWALAIGAAVTLANVLPPVYFAGSAVWLALSPSVWSAAALLLAALTVLLPARVMNRVRRLVDGPAWYAWTMPIGSALYMAILAASAWRYYRGGNIWKGRRYDRATISAPSSSTES